MGLMQEVTYKKYGKQWREGLFYTVSKIFQHCWGVEWVDDFFFRGGTAEY